MVPASVSKMPHVENDPDATFPLNELPDVAQSIVLSVLDRKTGRALMLTNRTWFELTKPYLWYEVRGFEAIIRLLPWRESVEPRDAGINQPSPTRLLTLPEPTTSEDTARLRVYNDHIHTLDLSRGGWTGGKAKITPPTHLFPLTPKLRKILLSPRLTADKE
ncbi:hypothetical protein FRC11_007351, partial [Ceratobasidium sp. 423]